MSYDQKYDNFLAGSPYTINNELDNQDVQFRLAGTNNFNLKKWFLVQENLNKIGMKSDEITKTFMKSSPPQHLEFHDELGYMFFALGKCLFIFKGTECLKMMTGKEKDLNEVVFDIQFKNAVSYLKISENNLYVVDNSLSINIYEIDNLISNLITNKGKQNYQPQLVDLKKYFKDPVNGFIRQISTDQIKSKNQKFLITTSEQKLIEHIPQQGLKVFPEKIRSAIYNQTGQYVVCLPNCEKKDQPHIFIYDTANKNDYKELQPAKVIILSFSEDVKRDYYKCYFLTEYPPKEYCQIQTIFIYSAFYASNGDQAKKIGTPLIFAIQDDLNNKTKIQKLKENKKIKFYYNTDLTHNADDDENCQIPVIRSLWVKDPKCQQKQQLCVLIMNHQISPFIFMCFTDGSMKQCEYQQEINIPKVIRPPPLGEDKGEMEAIDSLGATLGGMIMQSCIDKKYPGPGPETFNLFADRDDQFWLPPLLTLYSLNGDFFTWNIFLKEYQDQTCFFPIIEKITVQNQIEEEKQTSQSLSSSIINYDITKDRVREKGESFYSESSTGTIMEMANSEAQIASTNVNRISKLNLEVIEELNQENNSPSNPKHKTPHVQNSSKISFQDQEVSGTQSYSQKQKIEQNQQDDYGQEELYPAYTKQIEPKKTSQVIEQKIPQQKEEEKKQTKIMTNLQPDIPPKIKEKEEDESLEKQKEDLKQQYEEQLDKKNQLQLDQEQLLEERNTSSQAKLDEIQKEANLKNLQNISQLEKQKLEKQILKNEQDISEKIQFQEFLAQKGIDIVSWQQLSNEFQKNITREYQQWIFEKNDEQAKMKKFKEQQKLVQEQTKYDQEFLNKISVQEAVQVLEVQEKEIPVFQLCMLRKDEMLTEWYNHKVVESLVQYKKQVIADLRQLPIIDSGLVKQHQDIQIESQLKDFFEIAKKKKQGVSRLHKAFKLIQDDLLSNCTSKDREVEIEQNLHQFHDIFEFMKYLIDFLTKQKILNAGQSQFLCKLSERLRIIQDLQEKLNKQTLHLANIPRVIDQQLKQCSFTREEFKQNLNQIQILKQNLKEPQKNLQNSQSKWNFVFQSAYQIQKQSQQTKANLNRLFKQLTDQERRLYNFSKEFLELVFATETEFTSAVLQMVQDKVAQVEKQIQLPSKFSSLQITQPEVVSDKPKEVRSNKRAYGIIDEDLEDDIDTCDSISSQQKQRKPVGRVSLKERIAMGFKPKTDIIIMRTEKIFKENEQIQEKEIHDFMNHFKDVSLEQTLNEQQFVQNNIFAATEPVEPSKVITEQDLLNLQPSQIQIPDLPDLTQQDQQIFQSQKQSMNTRLSQLNAKEEEVKKAAIQLNKPISENSKPKQLQKESQPVQIQNINQIQQFGQEMQPNLPSEQPLTKPQAPQATEQTSNQEVSAIKPVVQKPFFADQKQQPQANFGLLNINKQIDKQEVKNQDQVNQLKKESELKVEQNSKQNETVKPSGQGFQPLGGAAFPSLGSSQPVKPQLQGPALPAFGNLNMNAQRQNFEAPKLAEISKDTQANSAKVFGSAFGSISPFSGFSDQNKNEANVQQTFDQPPQTNTFSFQGFNSQAQQNSGWPQQNATSPFASGSNFQSSFSQPMNNAFGNINFGQNNQFQNQLQNPDVDPFIQNSVGNQGFGMASGFSQSTPNFQKSQTQNFGKARKI